MNGEAIYGTSPWIIAGEGPTNLWEDSEIGFNEADTVYTKEDICCTVKGDTIYATFLDWPGEKAVIKTLRATGLEADEGEAAAKVDESMSLVGKTLTTESDGVKYTWVFKNDGKTFTISEDETPHYPGSYKEEIKRITMLGDGKELDWKLTRKGLVIDTPEKKPCEHAYVFKIERYHHPKID